MAGEDVILKLSDEVRITIQPNPSAVKFAISERIVHGQHIALQIAMLVAYARDNLFPTDHDAWMAWALEATQYQERYCYQCLNAGRLLCNERIRQGNEQMLLNCGIAKLEILETIKEDQLIPLLKKWDPSTKTIEEVRAKARLFRCRPEDADKEKQEKKPKEKKRQTSPADLDNLLARIGSLTESQRDEFSVAMPAAEGIRSGLAILEMSIRHLEREGNVLEMGHDAYVKASADCRQLADAFAELCGKVGE